MSEHPNPTLIMGCDIEYKTDCGYSCHCKAGYKETEIESEIKAEFG